jgi:hypothetical protein
MSHILSADAAGPVNLVMDLRITHERFGSICNPVLNGHLHYPLPADIDKLLNDAAAGKIREYRADYNNRPSNSSVYLNDNAFVEAFPSFLFSNERIPILGKQCIPPWFLLARRMLVMSPGPF